MLNGSLLRIVLTLLAFLGDEDLVGLGIDKFFVNTLELVQQFVDLLECKQLLF